MNRIVTYLRTIFKFFALSSIILGSNFISVSNAEAECVRHFYNKSDVYWYVRFFHESYSAGDYHYMTIPPHTTFRINYVMGNGTGAGTNDAGWFKETSPKNFDIDLDSKLKIRIQRYEGANKSGEPTYNSKFGVENEKNFGKDLLDMSKLSKAINVDVCPYFKHSGSTGLGTLNDPANGDLYLH